MTRVCPQDNTGHQMDPGEKVSGGFIIAGRDSSELLELANEILDEMARLVHLFVEVSRRLATFLGWNTLAQPPPGVRSRAHRHRRLYRVRQPQSCSDSAAAVTPADGVFGSDRGLPGPRY